jgi:hypothetical protein
MPYSDGKNHRGNRRGGSSALDYLKSQGNCPAITLFVFPSKAAPPICSFL